MHSEWEGYVITSMFLSSIAVISKGYSAGVSLYAETQGLRRHGRVKVTIVSRQKDETAHTNGGHRRTLLAEIHI